MGQTTGAISRILPADLGSVREARKIVHAVLIAWRAEEIFDDVALVATELVANALRHGVGVGAGQIDPVIGQIIRISLVCTGSHVICSVTDPSAQPPVRRPVEPMEMSGRGLQLVDSLSSSWGWTPLAGAGMDDAAPGKSVWAIFPVTRAEGARAWRASRPRPISV